MKHRPPVAPTHGAGSIELPALLWVNEEERGYLEDLFSRLAVTLVEKSQGHPSPASLGASSELAQAMADVVPDTAGAEGSPWREVVGPVYRSKRLEELLGVSRQAIWDRAQRGTLIALRTSDGHLVYPVFQFNDSHQPIAGMSRVWRTLMHAVGDDLYCLQWMRWPNARLDDQSAVDWLRTGGKPQTAIREAEAAAAVWRR